MSLGRPECLTLFARGNKCPTLDADQSKSTHVLGPAFYFSPYIVIVSAALCLNLTGCAAGLVALGSAGTTAASSASTTAVSVAIANPSTAASAISTATTGKSPLEHAASAATKQNCNFLNALGPKPICSDIPVPKIIDMSEPYLGPADRVPTPK
jgi:hypothetical protein